jgi:large conductance mechanosensitive channel
MKKFFEEFKQFALKGNVMDLAVGVIIGAAFQNIVTALTGDFITPLIAAITGHTAEDGTVTIGGTFTINGAVFNYGDFLSAVLNFIIMAFILFLIIKGVNKLMSVGKKPVAPGAPTTKICPFCKSTIDIEAVKCPHCTSDIPEEKKEEEKA